MEFRRIARRTVSLVTLVFFTLAGVLFVTNLRADDAPTPIDFHFGSDINDLAEVGPPSIDDQQSSDDPIRLVEIGGFGGIKLPDNVKNMMHAAEEMQSIQAKYDATITQLINEAKQLGDPENAIANAADVAALAKSAEQLRGQLDAKRKEMMANFGGGVGLFGAKAEAEKIEIFGGGSAEVEIFPRGALPKFTP